MEGGPPALQGYRPGVRAFLSKIAEGHQSVRKARLRKSDPDWVRDKFRAGHTLYRFDPDDTEHLVGYLAQNLDCLCRVADYTKARDATVAREAKAFLKCLTHRKEGPRALRREAQEFLSRAAELAERAEIRKKRHLALRDPLTIGAGALTGRRCQSIEEIARTGRGVGNCLRSNEGYWSRFLKGKSDVWVLERAGEPVAVLEVRRRTGTVVEAKDGRNKPIGLADAHAVALFCRVAEFDIDDKCEGLLLAYADPMVKGPLVIEVGGVMVRYAEWPRAVRIDLGADGMELLMEGARSRSLSVAFDPDLSLGAEMLEGSSGSRHVRAFGKKRLRQILRAVALERIEVTFVQSRLMLLAA